MRILDVVKFGCLGAVFALVLGCVGGGAPVGPVGGAGERDGFVVGDVAPDFRLAKLDGEVVRLSDYRGGKGVVLVFSRGHW